MKLFMLLMLLSSSVFAKTFVIPNQAYVDCEIYDFNQPNNQKASLVIQLDNVEFRSKAMEVYTCYAEEKALNYPVKFKSEVEYKDVRYTDAIYEITTIYFEGQPFTHQEFKERIHRPGCSPGSPDCCTSPRCAKIK